MPTNEPAVPTALPVAAEQVLTTLVQAARVALQDDLSCILLYGSGAEGRLRPSSDLNLLFVLKSFRRERVDAFREPLRMGRMAQRASVMFLLESELPLFAEAFAVKFDDLLRRHRVLYGENLLTRFAPSRPARIQRLRQIVFNLALRLRERYAALSLRDEQLVGVVNDLLGPLRAAAATLLELEGRTVESARAALHTIIQQEIPEAEPMLNLISRARQTASLPPGEGAPLVLQCMALLTKMHERLERLT